MSVATSKPPFVPVNLVIFAGFPIIALFLVPAWGFYQGYTGVQWLWAVVFLYLNGLAITGGYHRLWAHKAYEAHPLLRWWFALWGAGALQNSILIWAADHRRHHRHVDDNDRDPYSARRGLWFSHMGWMLREHRANQEDFSNVPDLQRDPIVTWQHRNYVWLTWTMNLGLPLALGIALGDVIGTVLLVGLLRLVVNHHVTFFINSLAHYWGRQPYTEENTARDNDVLAFLTYGEGYHNYHHLFQSDYRNGIRWYHWDPTKWMIRLCSWLGLARNLKRTPDFRVHRAILDTQFARAHEVLPAIPASHTLREKLEREYQLFTEAINTWTELQTARYERKKAEFGDAFEEKRLALQQRWEQVDVRAQARELEAALHEQRKRVDALIRQLQPQLARA